MISFTETIIKIFHRYFSLLSNLWIVCSIIFLLGIQIFQSLKVPSYGAWGIFHYYLGAKYVKELGYFDLYSCVMQIDNEKWHSVKFVRNLHTYQLVSLKELPRCQRNNFSNRRWDEFVADTTLIANRAPDEYWSQVVTDKGFNPPPPWAAFAGTIARVFPLNNLTYIILFNLDLMFICLTAIVVWHNLGRNAALITLALSLWYFGTFNALGNNFLQYAWYPLVAGFVVAWRLKKLVISGITLGLATGLQVFPIFFAIPVGFSLLVSLLRKQKDQIKKSSYFMLAFAVTLLFCVIIGSIYAGKFAIWQQWYNKITIHKNYINGEIFNIGFTNLVGMLISTDHENSYTYIEDYSHTQSRNNTIKQTIIISRTIVFLYLLFIFIILWRSKRNQPMVYGYFLLYLLLTLSPYYYLILALLPFMFWNNSIGVRRFTLYGICTLFFLHLILFGGKDSISLVYIPQLISKLLIFIFLTMLMVLLFLEKQKVLTKKHKLRSSKDH